MLVLLAGAVFATAVPAEAARLKRLPEWVRPAVRYLVHNGALDVATFRPNKAMKRSDFRRIMAQSFGGGYSRTEGVVTAREVDAALVKALGKGAVARRLSAAKSPDGWDPGTNKWFGTEIVAREMGLRRDHPPSEEAHETSASEAMNQGNVVWSVWKAKTSPSTWGADELASFSLPNYDDRRRKIVRFAFSQVGIPYVWGGDWPQKTPAGYPYGAQPHGGFDCSGFSWYVLRRGASGWDPMHRPYRGWDLPQRSSADMAGATKRRLTFKQLRPGDLMFFASGGRRAAASSVYHAGIYLGRGWMIDSSGSQDGVSLSRVGKGAWWHDQFAWGRRVIR